MALLSFDQELHRAATAWPFDDPHAQQHWESLWCVDCRHQQHCPLITLATVGRIPHAWEVRDQDSLNRYTCHEFLSQTEIMEDL